MKTKMVAVITWIDGGETSEHKEYWYGNSNPIYDDLHAHKVMMDFCRRNKTYPGFIQVEVFATPSAETPLIKFTFTNSNKI